MGRINLRQWNNRCSIVSLQISDLRELRTSLLFMTSQQLMMSSQPVQCPLRKYFRSTAHAWMKQFDLDPAFHRQLQWRIQDFFWIRQCLYACHHIISTTSWNISGHRWKLDNIYQSQKMYSFVPRAKLNGKVGFHTWFPLWFINIQRVLIFYEWIFCKGKNVMLLSAVICVFPQGGIAPTDYCRKVKLLYFLELITMHFHSSQFSHDLAHHDDVTLRSRNLMTQTLGSSDSDVTRWEWRSPSNHSNDSFQYISSDLILEYM